MSNEEIQIKAKELVERFIPLTRNWDDVNGFIDSPSDAKQCAIIDTSNTYNALREQLFNLRACKVIENESTYLKRVERLNEEELSVKQAIENL